MGIYSEMKESIRRDLIDKLKDLKPFSLLDEETLCSWISDSRIEDKLPGENILRTDEINNNIYLVLQGEIRLIAYGDIGEGAFTLGKRGKGQLIGWVSLLRGEGTENVIASTNVKLLALSAAQFITAIKNNKEFAVHFENLPNPHEIYKVGVAAQEQNPLKSKGWHKDLTNNLKRCKIKTIEKGKVFIVSKEMSEDLFWYMSSAQSRRYSIGSRINDKVEDAIDDKLMLPRRIVGIPKDLMVTNDSMSMDTETDEKEKVKEIVVTSLEELGIMEEDNIDPSIKFPIYSSRSKLGSVICACRMLAEYHKIPFRKDTVKKIVEGHLSRDKAVTSELIAALNEYMGLSTQIAEVNTSNVECLEVPAQTCINEIPIMIWEFKKKEVTIGDAKKGLQVLTVDQLKDRLGEKAKFVISKRTRETQTTKFGWGWFTPLAKKYKKPLLLVFVASLLAQLFGLAIPLLLQQIIDKVLSQGNLSSLNVLGSAMVVFALFQGLLQALRTYIFVDTTDRMDLTLGTAVIDRLLSLPLSFFEKRPVGELSQKLGELNTIRGFLTGTALISVLNLIFASIYLIVMFIYSPLLSVAALSTFPLYLLLVLVVAPIYKTLIRNRAIANASTMSHLIEVIGGIQTVKAQHFELTARWKWQDRYRKFVNEGFKSVALGTTAGEIGGFLNTLSGLLVLWIGMWLVLRGEFSLGQLIAFRIISGNVTSPLLQLAGLYQGFQSVQLSMERLSDIVDQTPELKNNDEIGQISLPTIKGKVSFENVSFRFGKKGEYQVNDVSLDVPEGTFVGIVGQSGSGKSTLMKLLPRLYNVNRGRILIDDYDISKVDLASIRRQVGIVPQDSLLFEGTVSENIALNDPQASTETIIQAAKIACAHDFIMELSDGYGTKLAEKGSNLSGGQRQRIAIARTILSNPQLLIMDEATSALDFDTEKQLCNNLQNWASGKTVFFITHRLSTISESELIVVMSKGSIRETGSHENLMRLNGRYCALYRQQQAVN